MESLWFELRYSLRGLIRSPIYTTVTVALLALGIGANTATFSIVRGVVLRPLPFADADRLLLLYEGIPEANLDEMPFSPADYLDLERFQSSFENVALFQSVQMELSGDGQPERVHVARTTSSLLATLGVQAALGRGFLAEEEEAGHRVTMLDYGLWQRRFAGSPDVLGQTVVLDRQPFEVVGVLPASLRFPLEGMASFGKPADLFVPRAFTAAETRQRGGGYNNDVLARLRPGTTLAGAHSELELLAERIAESYPADLDRYTLTLRAVPLRERVLGSVERSLWLLLAAVSLVLLVVCANLANLALSRAAGRQPEIAVRTALGAGRMRMTLSLLTESMLLATASAAVAVGVAFGSLEIALALLPEALPRSEQIRLDGPVLAFTASITLVATVLFGLAPLLLADTWRLRSTLSSLVRRNGGGRRQQRFQRGLVIATVGVAVVLLVAAGLMTRSFSRLIGTEPGFSARQVLTLALTLPNQAYLEGPRVRGFLSSLAQRVDALPGVERSSLSTALPTFSGERRAFTPEVEILPEVPPSPSVTWTYGPYFETLGVPLLEGRALSGADHETAEPVAVVSRALAERYWPGDSAVDKRLKWGLPDTSSPWMRIVGVVGDVNDGPLGAEPNPHIYVPFFQIPDAHLEAVARANSSFWRSFHLAVVATAGDPSRLTKPVISEIRRLDSDLAVAGPQTMEQMLARGVAPQRFGAALTTTFGATALLLSAVGLYGLLALAVAARRREIGLRMALGADRSAVTGLVVGQGLRLVTVGLALGLLGAGAASRLLRTVLYETTPLDIGTFVVASLVLLGTALAASLLPAWRASRIEPTQALRAD